MIVTSDAKHQPARAQSQHSHSTATAQSVTQSVTQHRAQHRMAQHRITSINQHPIRIGTTLIISYEACMWGGIGLG